MLVGTLIQVVRRRWLVVLAGVLLTGLAAAAVVNLQPPRYTVSATALLLPPKVSSDGTETNPYLQLGGLTTAVDVLARALNDPRVHDQVVKSGETSDFIAERDFLTAAPLLVVTAESTSADRAREIRDDVLDAAPEVLSELQATVGVPASSRLTMETIVSDGAAELAYKAVLRTVIVVVAAGLAGSLLLAGGVDAWLIRRKARKDGRAGEGEEE